MSRIGEANREMLVKHLSQNHTQGKLPSRNHTKSIICIKSMQSPLGAGKYLDRPCLPKRRRELVVEMSEEIKWRMIRQLQTNLRMGGPVKPHSRQNLPMANSGSAEICQWQADALGWICRWQWQAGTPSAGCADGNRTLDRPCCWQKDPRAATPILTQEIRAARGYDISNASSSISADVLAFYAFS